MSEIDRDWPVIKLIAKSSATVVVICLAHVPLFADKKHDDNLFYHVYGVFFTYLFTIMHTIGHIIIFKNEFVIMTLKNGILNITDARGIRKYIILRITRVVLVFRMCVILYYSLKRHTVFSKFVYLRFLCSLHSMYAISFVFLIH